MPSEPVRRTSVRLDLGVEVAVVGVEVLDLLRGRLPVGPAVRARPPERGAVGAERAEGVVRLQLLAREPAVALDVEGADIVLLALVHIEVQHGLAAGRIGNQGIVGDLEVDEALVGIPARQPLAHVLIDLSLVVLAVLEPPEAFGPGGHVLDHRLVVESLVAVDDHLADGDALAFLHVEDEPDAVRVLRHLDRLDLGRVVAGPLVERVDGRARLLDGVAVERPAFGELDPALDLAFRQLLDAPDRPLPEHRPLLDLEDQDQPVGRRCAARRPRRRTGRS